MSSTVSGHFRVIFDEKSQFSSVFGRFWPFLVNFEQKLENISSIEREPQSAYENAWVGPPGRVQKARSK